MEPLQDLPPLPRGPPTKLLKLPMSQEDKQRLTQALREKLGPELADLQAELIKAREKDLDPHNAYLLQKDPGERHRLATIQGAPAHQWIDQVSAKVCDVLQKAQALAIVTCTTKITNPGGKHFKPRGPAKQWRRMAEMRKALAKHHRGACSVLPAEVLAALAAMKGGAGATQPLPNPTSHEGPDKPTREELIALNAKLKREMEAMSKEQSREEATARRNQMIKLVAQRPRVGNKIVLGTAGERPEAALRVLHNPATGKNTTNPEEIIGIVTDFMSQKVAAPRNSKMGNTCLQRHPGNTHLRRPIKQTRSSSWPLTKRAPAAGAGCMKTSRTWRPTTRACAHWRVERPQGLTALSTRCCRRSRSPVTKRCMP
jgi:hypothetical protein